jgi:hypothetical protein
LRYEGKIRGRGGNDREGKRPCEIEENNYLQ